MSLKVMTTAVHGLPNIYSFEHLIDGWVVTPENKGWFSPEMAGPVLIDNGAYLAHIRDELIDPLHAWRAQCLLAAKYADRPCALVLPDCIGDADQTMIWAEQIFNLSQWWYERAQLSPPSSPVMFVLQPGYDWEEVRDFTNRTGIQRLFIGGPDWDWKRRVLEDLRDEPFILHVGKVCRMNELIYCYAHPTVESVDNSTFSNGLNHLTVHDYIRRLKVLQSLEDGTQSLLVVTP